MIGLGLIFDRSKGRNLGFEETRLDLREEEWKVVRKAKKFKKARQESAERKSIV